MVTVRGVSRAGVTRAWVQKVAKHALAAVRSLPRHGRGRGSVSVSFVTDRVIAKLNMQFRRKRGPTDILSFGTNDPRDLGDVFIAPMTARRRARARNMPYRQYLSLLIVHGVLHLAGFDHERAGDAKKMERLERRILES